MKSLVLLDLDKTLIDVNYQLIVPTGTVRKSVQECSEAGIRIGLCSDSPLSLLETWSEILGLTGPIIFEQGAGVRDHITQGVFATLPEATAWFPQLRARLVAAALEKAPRCGIFVGDNTSLVASGVSLPGPCERYFLVSGLRQYSFGAHVRRRDSETGVLLLDSEIFRDFRVEVEAIARSLTEEELDVDENPEYGILILHVARNVKANGVRALLDRHSFSRVVYVGDSWRDNVSDSRVTQTAVGNAQDEYKRHCSFIAQATYTEGVLEILERVQSGFL